MAQFKEGDVVKVKSGGPPMTVESVNADGSYTCVWFDKDGKKRVPAKDVFKEVVLEKSEPAGIYVG